VLCLGARLRFERDGADFVAVVPLPNASPQDLDVAKLEEDLVIRTASRRRSIRLPRRIAELSLAEAKLTGASLRVRFRRRAPAEAEAR
jgi:HSP20 family molecular chaperone IbpA